jgi:hypothetical protein
MRMLAPSGNLCVTFSREGEVEHLSICPDGEKALKAAMIMLATQDALRAGDEIKVEWHRRPNIIERHLA